MVERSETIELYPYRGVPWSRAVADREGCCVLSGFDIKPGDAVYVTDAEGLRNKQVLVPQYDAYQQFLREKHDRRRASEPEPEPGSPEAVAIGCTCDPVANRYVLGLSDTGEVGFVPDNTCLLHGLEAMTRLVDEE